MRVRRTLVKIDAKYTPKQIHMKLKYTEYGKAQNTGLLTENATQNVAFEIWSMVSGLTKLASIIHELRELHKLGFEFYTMIMQCFQENILFRLWILYQMKSQ